MAADTLGSSNLPQPSDVVRRSVKVADHVQYTEDDLKNVIVIDSHSGKLFGLRNTAAVMWVALAVSGVEDAAVKRITDTYRIDAARAAVDVRAFLDKLLAAGLMVSSAGND
jgi:hypothetical protein